MPTPSTTPPGKRYRSPSASVRRALRRAGWQRGDVETAVRRVFAPHLKTSEGGRTFSRWRKTMRLLRPLGSVSLGNRIEVLTDGDDAFEAMWRAIDGAGKRVLLESYTFAPDAVGKRTLSALERAAARGCEVVLVVDALGSYRLAERFVRPLVDAGGLVAFFNPPLAGARGFSRLVRDHRKLLVIDDAVGFCGGRNVAEEYAGKRHGKDLFHDVHLRVEGPCISGLGGLVLRTFEEVSGKRLSPGVEAAGSPDGALVQILESNVRRQRRAIQRALRHTTRRSVHRCYLTTPYFVPPKRLLRGLRRAARRGVDVRVLTAGKSDVPLVRFASRHLYGRLLRAGVRIYEMQGRILHAKTATVDGVYTTVGSFNLDVWSYRRNLEVNVSALDAGVAARLERRFREDLSLAEEVTWETWSRRSWLRRTLDWAAYQLMRI